MTINILFVKFRTHVRCLCGVHVGVTGVKSAHLGDNYDFLDLAQQRTRLFKPRVLPKSVMSFTTPTKCTARVCNEVTAL